MSCVVYRGGRRRLLLARPIREGQWQVEGLTATPFASLAAISHSGFVHHEEVGEYVQHLLIQAPQHRCWLDQQGRANGRLRA